MVIDDDTEGYVAYYDVQDEDDDAEPRFFAIWTTKKLMERCNNRFNQDDATDLLMWQGYPFFLSFLLQNPKSFFQYQYRRYQYQQ